MNNYTIIPTNLTFQGAPSVDQEIIVSLDGSTKTMTEYDRSSTISLAQVYDDERQASITFRPTFKISYIYPNVFTGTTDYAPFRNFLYYVQPELSKTSNVWKGFPQYYEFDFYRPDVFDGHLNYRPISAYTYNWNFYFSYAFENDSNRKLSTTIDNVFYNWTVSDGIPFIIKNRTQNGNTVISFECIMPHGLTPGESVELSFTYGKQNIFEVFTLGNDFLESSSHIFNIYNVGYTGNTFSDGVKGTFKRVVDATNLTETRCSYYIRRNKILTNTTDTIVTKSGFEKNPFNEERKFEYSSITPNNISRVSQKTSSNSYTVTTKRDLELSLLLDNQKRPISELFLTIINHGYSGYFNKPNNNVGLKQGWLFNVTSDINPWWDSNNVDSNSNIPVSSYTKTVSGVTKTFYYNQPLKIGDVIDGDICEWNEYYQTERVISNYYQKIVFNQDNFQTVSAGTTNIPGYYYKPHQPMTLRVFSDYIETGDINFVDGVPSWSYFSNTDQSFRWRDLYSYGFIDNLERGVDYPFLNNAQYPFKDTIFRVTPDNFDFNLNSILTGVNIPYDPTIDECE